jgi:hypothetical protein
MELKFCQKITCLFLNACSISVPVKVKGLEETPPATFSKPHRIKDKSVVVSGIFRNPQVIQSI